MGSMTNQELDGMESEARGSRHTPPEDVLRLIALIRELKGFKAMSEKLATTAKSQLAEIVKLRVEATDLNEKIYAEKDEVTRIKAEIARIKSEEEHLPALVNQLRERFPALAVIRRAELDKINQLSQSLIRVDRLSKDLEVAHRAIAERDEEIVRLRRRRK